MTHFEAIILGIVEGITEFLPISSTGHLAVVANWLGVNDPVFLPSFLLAVQVGAILAVVVLYAQRLFLRPPLWGRLAIAMIPTIVIGITLYPLIRGILDNVVIVAAAMIIGGIIMIVVERWVAKRKNPEPALEQQPEYPSFQQSLIIGLYQIIAFIPGVSRSAATIIGGLIHRVPRVTVVEFSFMLAVPTMMAALGYDLYKSSGDFVSADWGVLTLGAGVAFIVAIVSIRLLLRYIKRYSFEAFGWYRIVAGIIFLLVMML